MKQEKDLILSLTKKDFVIRTFRVSGNGGQKVNKTSSGVEIIHPASGAVGRCTDTRSQHKNKHIALKRLTETASFKSWLYSVTRGLKTPREIEEQVKLELSDPDITITEIRESKDTWRRIDPKDLT